MKEFDSHSIKELQDKMAVVLRQWAEENGLEYGGSRISYNVTAFSAKVEFKQKGGLTLAQQRDRSGCGWDKDGNVVRIGETVKSLGSGESYEVMGFKRTKLIGKRDGREYLVPMDGCINLTSQSTKKPV